MSLNPFSFLPQFGMLFFCFFTVAFVFRGAVKKKGGKGVEAEAAAEKGKNVARSF